MYYDSDSLSIIYYVMLYVNDNNHDNRTDDKVMNIMTLIHCDGYVR